MEVSPLAAPFMPNSCLVLALRLSALGVSGAVSGGVWDGGESDIIVILGVICCCVVLHFNNNSVE